MQKRYKLTVAYDGSSYHGWQSQKNAASIQEIIENALSAAAKIPLCIQGAGRTDAGVHALEQVAHFDAPIKLTPAKINLFLPADIRILSVTAVPKEFHARYSAKGKIYEYYVHINENGIHDPFSFPFSYTIRKLDLPLAEAKARLFVGTHDFSSFTNKGTIVMNYVRTITEITFLPTDEGFCLRFHGNGFLYKMVRNLVGCLLDNEVCVEKAKKILAKKDRRLGVAPACAKGLFLAKVLYQ